MRWKFLIPTVIIIAAVVIFTVFFLDAFLKRGLINSGQAIFGAKVEVGSFKTSLLNLGVNIRELQIADRNNEFRNLLEIDNINFSVRLMPMFSARFIINDMTISGVKWGTARTTSGRLPPREQRRTAAGEPTMLSRAMGQVRERTTAELNALPAAQTIGELTANVRNFDPAALLEMAGINSLDQIQTAYSDLTAQFNFYSQELSNINPQVQIDAITESVRVLSAMQVRTVEDVARITQQIEVINAQQQVLRQNLQTLQNLRRDVSAQAVTVRNLNDLINQDIARVMSLQNLPDMETTELARALFGSAWVDRVEQVLHYMELIQQFFPEQDPDRPALIRERQQGRDISFPIRGELPQFLISNITISGSTGGAGKTGDVISFAGNIRNVSSDQRVTGVPMTLHIAGDDTQHRFAVEGVFDRRTAVSNDTITITADGLPATILGVPNSDFTPSFDGARTAISAVFNMVGSAFSTNLALRVWDLRFDATPAIHPDAARYLAILWGNIHTVNVNAGMSFGGEAGTQFNFSSDIDRQLAEGFRNIFGQALVEVEARIRSEITSIINTQQARLTAEINRYKTDLLNRLNIEIGDIDRELGSVAEAITRAQGQSLQDTLQRTATDALRRLF